MNRRPKLDDYELHHPFAALERFDAMLKHAKFGLQCLTQAMDGLREVLDSGHVAVANQAQRVASVKGLRRLRVPKSEPASTAPVGATARPKRPR